jgi:hypothetical protein
MAGSGKVVSRIVEFPTFSGRFCKETRGTRWSNKEVQWILYSIELFALVGSNNNFIIDAGCQERIYGGGFCEHRAYINLETRTKRLPHPVPSNGRKKKLHTFFYWRWSFSFKGQSFESLSGITSKWLKGTNFQLQNLQSPRSCGKYIWPRVISFPNFS